MQKWIILGVVILIVVIGAIVVFNVNIETEYIPESEIEETELRKTIVSLYFLEKETGEISKETRLIDSKELLKNPYEKILNMLIEGPKGVTLDKIIPDGVSIKESKFENGTVIINFSSEFKDIENKEVTIEAIRKALTELNEVTDITVLIEGEEYNNENEKLDVEKRNMNIDTNIVDDNVSENLMTAQKSTIS